MDVEINEDQGFVEIANELLSKCGIRGEISQIQECGDAYFVNIYKELLGEGLKGIISNPLTSEDQAHNCQAVIDTLASDVLNTDLSHISGINIVKKDRVSIRNLLEIFAGLLEYFVEITEEGILESDEDDSNIVPSDHDVISDILLEELGPEYRQKSGESIHTLGEGKVPVNETKYQDTQGELRSSQPRPYAPERDWSTQSTTAQKQEIQELVELRKSLPDGFERNQRSGNGKLPSASILSGYAASMETDISKVSDSTTELIKLGETSCEKSTPSKPVDFRGKSLHMHPEGKPKLSSLDDQPFENQKRVEHHRPNITEVCGGERNQHSFEDKRIKTSKRAGKYESLNISKSSQNQGTAAQSTDDSKQSDQMDLDHELTQYTLQSEEDKHKTTSPTGSILSSSSTSASWPQQISPLDPDVDGSSSAAGFGSLGVRPQYAEEHITKSSDGSGSGRSSPILHHHYHHHFHHPSGTQKQVPHQLPLTSATGRVPATSDSNVEVPMKPDSSTDITGATKVLGSAAVSSPKRLSGSRVISSDEVKKVHERGAAPLSENLRMRSSAPVSYSTRWPGSGSKTISLSRNLLPESDNFLRTAPPRYAWADSSDDSRKKRPLTGGRLPSSVAASATATTLSDSVFSTGTKTLTGLEKQFEHVGSERSQEPKNVDGRPVQDSAAENFLIKTKSAYKNPGARKTEDDGDTEESWGSREPPTVQRSRYDNLLAKYRRLPRGVMEDEETEESQLSESGEYDDLELVSDSAVDYGEKDSIERLVPDSSSQITDTKRKTKDFSKSKGVNKRGLKSKAQREVRFNEDVETIPITSRVERLRQIMDTTSREERAQHTQNLRSVYRDQLRDLQREQHALKRKKQADSPKVPKKKRQSKMQRRGRLEKVYCSQTRRPPRKPKRETAKGRKRSASASPVLRHRKTSPARIDEGDELLPAMLEEFPFLHVSPQTAHNMWTKQARQVSALLRSDTEAKKTKTQRMVEEAERRQESLVKILKKELEHNQRMREQQQRMDRERAVKIKLREKRQVSARARKYYDEYQLRMRARMLKRRTREEQIFKRLFEDGLEIQKQRIRELRQYAKEKREAQAKRQQNEIQSLENYYRDQFSMLAENMARERYELECREKAQDKVMKQLRKELRQKMENEIKDFQENLNRDEDSAYFRQLEADRLRREFQLATNKTFF